jgi:hypothetical protein
MPSLTVQHRAAQLAIRALLIKRIVPLMPLLDIKAIDETWTPLQESLMALIGISRSHSIAVATTYYSALRASQGITTPLPGIPAINPKWEIGARISLEVVGPVLTKQSILTNSLDPLGDALVRISGAASRHALDGGRDAIGAYVRAEHFGYRRITAANACPFCRMLAGRGAVYGRETVNFRSHDHCSCTSEPVLRPRVGSSGRPPAA